MSSSLTWSEKFNCGHSEECYFGSLPNRENMIMIYRSFSRGEPAWRIMFNDASMRRAEIEAHPSFEAAKAYAEKCIRMPIPEIGYRSLANNAVIIAIGLCRPGDATDDIEAAIDIARQQYPDARITDIRTRVAERFAGSLQRHA